MLSIPTVRDRVVQTALKLLLEPLFEPHFSLHSHGFRPGRSQHQAECWLKTPVQLVDGTLQARDRGTTQGGVASPLLTSEYGNFQTCSEQIGDAINQTNSYDRLFFSLANNIYKSLNMLKILSSLPENISAPPFFD